MRWKQRNDDWSRSWPRPASWSTSRQTTRALADHLRGLGHRAEVEAVTTQATTLSEKAGIRAACAAVGVAQAGYYRRNQVSAAPTRRSPVAHRDRSKPRALSPLERQRILDVLHSERFVDLAPAEVWATLLDEGVYLGSESTFYRLLRAGSAAGERRRQATHPAAVKPELIACRPSEVYSWDITKLHGPAKWTYCYLYVIVDIYSRYAVGGMLASRGSAVLAEKLIADTCAKQGISRGQLTLHADRGSSMTSKPVAFLLADLDVAQSHSRPHVFNDNPFSEAAYKTLKYRPVFPEQLGSIEAARAHGQRVFTWYNDVHHHGGLGLHTPNDVHHVHVSAVREQRAVILSAAYQAHPERYVRHPPMPPKIPSNSWINPPKEIEDIAQ
jgi:putative transposase